jgi:RNA-directed DNA polymerase
MIEDVINPRNMQQACIQVARNKGSAGLDGMSVRSLKDFVRRNRVQVSSALKRGDYRPEPILGVGIPKSDGKTRLLGIPTVIDRWLQQCVAQAITPKFEFDFKPHSYGFRPGKNAQQCVLQNILERER